MAHFPAQSSNIIVPPSSSQDYVFVFGTNASGSGKYYASYCIPNADNYTFTFGSANIIGGASVSASSFEINYISKFGIAITCDDSSVAGKAVKITISIALS